jgi:hypothetical protein
MSVSWLWLRSSDLNRNIKKIRGQHHGISLLNKSGAIAKSRPIYYPSVR